METIKTECKGCGVEIADVAAPGVVRKSGGFGWDNVYYHSEACKEAAEEKSSREFEAQQKIEQDARRARALAFEKKIRKAFTLCGLEPYGKKDEYHETARARTPGMGDDPLAYLWASFDRYGNKGRIAVSVGLANEISGAVYKYDEDRGGITISGDKTAEQVAADIRRRILPKFTDIEARAAEAKKGKDAYGADRDAVLSTIKGGPLNEGEQRSAQVYKGEITARYCGEGSATLEIRDVPLAKIRKILKIVGE